MAAFSSTVIDFWSRSFSGEVIYNHDGFAVTVNSGLPADRRVMLLEMADGGARAVLIPELAERLNLYQCHPEGLSTSVFRQIVADTGGAFHGADYLFYFSEGDKDVLLGASPDAGDPERSPGARVRRLTEADRAAFAGFESAASEDDLDAAYVELDHWVVFGAFEQDRLVCVASMYPWEDSRLADLGVLTLPDFRGRGHARRVVRAICKYAVEQGYEPQYRCQLDNLASKALAERSGLTLFGVWDVVSSDAPTN